MKNALLAIELSSKTSSVAIARRDENGQLDFRQRDFSGERGRALLAEIDQLFSEADLDKHQLGGILVGVGPGSYTGLRIACAAAHTLGLALEIPYAGLSSFEVAALSAPQDANQIHILQDAYRQEAYYAICERDGQNIALKRSPGIVPLNEIPSAATLQDHWLICDERLRKHLPRAEDILFGPTAEDLLRLAITRGAQLDGKGLDSFLNAEPLYLRAAAFRS